MSTVSYDFLDPQQIAADLCDGVEMQDSALGLLVCDAQVDYDQVAASVSGRLGIPLTGCTTLSFPLLGNDAEVSARLVVFQRQGLTVSVAVSEKLRRGWADTQMEQLVKNCLSGFEGTPAMYLVLVPLMEGLVGEHFTTRLFSYTGDVPVFGGMSSADMESGRGAVFLGAESWTDRIVLLALGGVRPVFAVGNQLTVMSDYSPTVTQSRDNIVYRVDDMTFVDYIHKMGFAPSGDDTIKGTEALFRYGPLPVLLRGKLAQDDGVPEIRGIESTNPGDGSGSFTSDVPVGTRISLGTLQKSDIVASAERCINSITSQMAAGTADGYTYSLLLSVPCVSRYFTQVGGRDLEGALLNEKIPPTLSASSFYAFCEVSPTMGTGGQVHNRTHADSIVMAAL